MLSRSVYSARARTTGIDARAMTWVAATTEVRKMRLQHP